MSKQINPSIHMDVWLGDVYVGMVLPNAEGVKAHGPYGSETFNDASAAADWLAERYTTIERPNEKALVPYDAEPGSGAIWCNADGEPARIAVGGHMVVLDDPAGVYIAE